MECILNAFGIPLALQGILECLGMPEVFWNAQRHLEMFWNTSDILRFQNTSAILRHCKTAQAF